MLHADNLSKRYGAHAGVASGGLVALLVYIVGAAGFAQRRLRRFRPDG